MQHEIIIEIDAEKINENEYLIRFSIDKLSEKTGIPEEKLAKLLADEFMKVLGLHRRYFIHDT